MGLLDRLYRGRNDLRAISSVDDIRGPKDIRRFFLQETADEEMARVLADAIELTGVHGYVDVAPASDGPRYAAEMVDSPEGPHPSVDELKRLQTQARALFAQMGEVTTDAEWDDLAMRVALLMGGYVRLHINAISAAEYEERKSTALSALRAIRVLMGARRP